MPDFKTSSSKISTEYTSMSKIFEIYALAIKRKECRDTKYSILLWGFHVSIGLIFIKQNIKMKIFQMDQCKPHRTSVETLAEGAEQETSRGNISHTIHENQCITWSNQIYYIWGRYDHEFADNDIIAAGNSCRNPNNFSFPWCYTIQNGVTYQLCSIPFCPGHCCYDKSPFCTDVTVNTRNCKTTQQGSDYGGNISYTIQGYQCQAWNQQHPHEHLIGVFDYEFPDKDVYAAGNSCRNPKNGELGPWCYTTQYGVECQFCSIPFCAGYCNYDKP